MDWIILYLMAGMVYAYIMVRCDKTIDDDVLKLIALWPLLIIGMILVAFLGTLTGMVLGLADRARRYKSYKTRFIEKGIVMALQEEKYEMFTKSQSDEIGRYRILVRELERKNANHEVYKNQMQKVIDGLSNNLETSKMAKASTDNIIIFDLKQEIETLQAELSMIRHKECQLMSSQVQDLERIIEEDKKNFQSVVEEKNHYRGKLTELTEELKSVSNELAKRNNVCSGFSHENEDLMFKVNELKDKLKKARKDLRDSKEVITVLHHKAEDYKLKSERLWNTVKKRDLEIVEKTEQVSKVSERDVELNKDYIEAQKHINKLQKLIPGGESK